MWDFMYVFFSCDNEKVAVVIIVIVVKEIICSRSNSSNSFDSGSNNGSSNNRNKCLEVVVVGVVVVVIILNCFEIDYIHVWNQALQGLILCFCLKMATANLVPIDDFDSWMLNTDDEGVAPCQCGCKSVYVVEFPAFPPNVSSAMLICKDQRYQYFGISDIA